jgi:hypothetical protein
MSDLLVQDEVGFGFEVLPGRGIDASLTATSVWRAQASLDRAGLNQQPHGSHQ